MRVRSPRLGQRVVTVVPHHHQPEIVHRRENRAARADHQPRAPPQRRQPAPVARGRTQTRRQRNHRGLVEQRRRRPPHGVDVALVRNDHQRRATGLHGLGGRFGETIGPRLPGQRLPHRPRRAAFGQRRQELSAAAVGVPPSPIDRANNGKLWRRVVFAFDLGVPRRHREPQHVGAGAGITGRDGSDQTANLRGEHRLGRHDAVQPGEFADVIGLGATLQDEPVDQAAVEPQSHPHAGLRVVGLLLGHEVIELTIQVRHRQHRQHPSNRLECGGLPGPGGHSSGVTEAVDIRPKKTPAVISTCAAA